MRDLSIQDKVKRLYQRHMGPEHLAAERGEALARLAAESRELGPASPAEPLFEPLGEGLCRLNLRPMREAGLSLETACGMFQYTAGRVKGDWDAFLTALDVLETQNPGERAWLSRYRREGCPAVSHSDAYRQAFAPAYRVVLDLFRQAFGLFLRVDRMGEGIVAIDGPCASGKSTLAAAVAQVYGACVLPMDDFFLQPHQRTGERLAQPGGNADRERFAAEGLAPLRAGRDFTYTPYNCAVQAPGAPVFVKATPVRVVEGVYCMHPELIAAYDLKVFLTVDPDAQRERLLRRNGGALLRRFESEWIPLENRYFEAFGVREACDLTLKLTL